jgi:hypothetical protein
MTLNLSEMMGGDGANAIPEGMTMSGKIMSKGTALVEKSTGRLVSYEGSMKSNQKMEGGQMEATITGNTTISLKLQK